MSKFLRLFQKVVVITSCLCVLCLWVIGTTITIQIDNERFLEERFMEEKIQNITRHVDQYCSKLERKILMENDVQNLLHLHAQISGSNNFSQKNPNYSQNGDAMATFQKLKERHSRNTILHNTLVYIKDLEQMWCLVPKAASTSWSKALIDYLNKDKNHPKILYNKDRVKKRNIIPTPLQVVLKAAYKYKNISYEEALRSNSVKKVLLVRHPFDRLVSAYEDKLKNLSAKSDSLYFFRNYGRKIIRLIRKRGSHAIKQKEPTFEEFIEYLLRTNPLHYDEHWQPINLQCDLCNIQYDHVIRQEDLAEMSSFHLAKLGFPSNFLSKKNQMSSVPDGTIQNFPTYFKNIPRHKMIQLFEKYQDDFNLFDYKFFDYYSASS